MNQRHRKLVLTLHTTVTGAWIGSVVAYLALVIAAMTGSNDRNVVSVWSALNLLAWYVIVPVAISSLLSGLAIALATPWGLFSHKWVVSSLGLTVAAVAVLLGHMPTVSNYASEAASNGLTDSQALRAGLQGELLHAGVGLLVLLTIQALNIYKPAGLTRHGRRLQADRPTRGSPPAEPPAAPVATRAASLPWGRIAWIHVAIVVALFAAVHLVLGGVPNH